MKLEIPIRPAESTHFQVWEYRVSHKQLLLRRPKPTDSATNVDVMFYNVEYMDLPSIFLELESVDPTADDKKFAERRIGKAVDKERLFVLKSSGRRHIVVAGKAVVRESSMAIFESPFSLPPVNLKDSRISGTDRAVGQKEEL